MPDALRPLRALIVDDQRDMLMTLGILLRSEGLTVRLGERCPVLIAVTGHKTDAARRLIEKSGFHHYVPKPYDFDALIRLVHSIERKPAMHA